jgi:hypothetical protein
METSRVQFNKNSDERRKKRTKILFVLLLLFLLIVAGVVAFLRKANLQINEVSIVGTHAVDPQLIRQFVTSQMKGNYVLVIPKSNTLLFSKRSMRAKILSYFPGLSDASIQFIDHSHIEISVEERPSHRVWCNTKDRCYFIDDEGVTYREAPIFSDGIYTIFSGSLLDIPQEQDQDQALIKTRFITASDFHLVTQIVGRLRETGLTMYEVHINENRDLEIRLGGIETYPVSSNALLLTSLDRDAKELASTISLLLDDKGFINAIANRGKELETIDLRFPGKIFYKFTSGDSIGGPVVNPVVSATGTQSVPQDKKLR